MAEYIEREALVKYIERLRDKCEQWSLLSGPLESHVRKRLCDFILSHIKRCPAADVEPIRHGRWIYREDEILGAWVECPVCHIETLGDFPRCPVCGAYMDLEEEA